MGKKGDLSDFERGMVVGARWVGLSISKTAHCVNCAKGCGFNSQGTHILTKLYSLNAL